VLLRMRSPADIPMSRTPGRGWPRGAFRLALAALLGSTLACAATAASEHPEPTAMRGVFTALSQLLPIALSGSIEEWSSQRATALAAAAALRDAAEPLAEHGAAAHDASFRLLGRSLASDARTLGWNLERERYVGAAHLTERVIETCIACHIRLPAAAGADFSETLFARVDRSRLSPFARASLQISARQFDAALQTLEAQLDDSTPDLTSIGVASTLNSYLIVALRVQRDPARASRGLAVLARRSDLGAQLELNLPLWQRALVELAPTLQEPPSLERAQQVLDAGRALSQYPFDAADRIHAIVASSLIFRFLDERAPRGAELAEALFLLSRTEAFTRQSSEIPESCAYLEQAIRAAPHSAIAERAYASLELQIQLQFSSPDGMTLPAHIHSWLRELRALASTRERPDGGGEAVAAGESEAAQAGSSPEKGLAS
jgi:hypothetical protein